MRKAWSDPGKLPAKEATRARPGRVAGHVQFDELLYICCVPGSALGPTVPPGEGGNGHPNLGRMDKGVRMAVLWSLGG